MVSEFIQSLLDKKIIPQEEMSSLIQKSEEGDLSLEILIIRNKLLSEKEFFRQKSEFFNIPFVEVRAEDIPSNVLQEIPEDAANNYKIAPLKIEKDELHIGIVNPDDFSAKSAIEFLTKEKHGAVKQFLISFSNFEDIIKQYHIFKEEVDTALEELKKERVEDVVLSKEEERVDRIVEEAPVSKIVAVILRNAVEGKASDIHIEPFGAQLRVRFRLDGTLHSSLSLEKKLLSPVVSRIKILSNLRIDEMRKPQDGRFTSEISGRRIDFRVASFPTAQGEKIVLRVLDPYSTVIGKSLDDLGFEGRNRDVLEKASKIPFGSIIFCGPTGSGKSTSQYGILQKLNSEGVNIVTLEDPVEYWVDGINQSQVRPEIGYTFAQGLRQIVRQDPDIIMVGEVRDKETADLVTHAALTGHLVLFTLHTNDAVGAIPRMVDLGVEPFLIPSTIKVIVSQRLVRKLCQSCKKKVKPNPKQEEIIKEELKKITDLEIKKRKISKDIYLYQADGCPKCLGKGTKGRIGIFEVLTMTDQLAEIILKESFGVELVKEATRQGMVTLKQDGILKALEGSVSLEEVLKTVEIKEKFD